MPIPIAGNTETSLMDLYDSIKGTKPEVMGVPSPVKMTPMQIGAYHHKIGMHGHDLKDHCCKRLLVDLYCHIIPFDRDYVDQHRSQLGDDVSKLLDRKNMSPTEYLTSAFEKTKSPMLEYVLRNVDLISQCYLKEAEELAKDAEEGLAPSEPPEPPTTEEEPVNSQLVDLEKDMEYQHFMDILKKKTVDKIVQDVSDLIISKKQDQDMTFDTGHANSDDGLDLGSSDMDDLSDMGDNLGTPEEGGEEASPENNENDKGNDEIEDLPEMEEPKAESAVLTALDYINKNLNGLKFTESEEDEKMGMAIREATLFMIDSTFRMNNFMQYESAILFGNGLVVNIDNLMSFVEDTQVFTESAKVFDRTKYHSDKGEDPKETEERFREVMKWLYDHHGLSKTGKREYERDDYSNFSLTSDLMKYWKAEFFKDVYSEYEDTPSGKIYKALDKRYDKWKETHRHAVNDTLIGVAIGTAIGSSMKHNNAKKK